MCRGLQAGTIWVNTWNQFDTAVPFGGYKLSGIGREHGSEVLDHYTQVGIPQQLQIEHYSFLDLVTTVINLLMISSGLRLVSALSIKPASLTWGLRNLAASPVK